MDLNLHGAVLVSKLVGCWVVLCFILNPKMGFEQKTIFTRSQFSLNNFWRVGHFRGQIG